MWWASTSTRRSRRSCCRWMRNPKSKPWIGLRPCCRCDRVYLSVRLMTTSGTAPPRSSPRSRWPPARSSPLRPEGAVIDACYPRHRHQEFLRFLKQVAKAYPRRELHIVLDNYGTHKHPTVTTWLEHNPRITLHFTPTSGSWLNLVEIFFGIITRQAIRRGSFASVQDLINAIHTFIDGWNERCAPFVWTKTAEQILEHATPKKRQETSFTRH